jgi:hypothetical protein
MNESLIGLNRLLSQPNGAIRNYDDLIQLSNAYIDFFRTPQEIVSSEPDDLRPILTCLQGELPGDLEIYLAKIMKILLRNPANRRALGKNGLTTLVKILKRQCTCRTSAAGEIGNVILNACYNGENVASFIEVGGITPLCNLLRIRDLGIVSGVLGALQGICYVPAGRYEIRRDIEVRSFIFYNLYN